MMVKWANDGLLKANASKVLINDGVKCLSMMVNERMIIYSIRSFDHYWEAAPTDNELDINPWNPIKS